MRARPPNDRWWNYRRWLIRASVVGVLLIVAWTLTARPPARWTGQVIAITPHAAVVLRDTTGQQRTVALRGVRPIEGERAALVAYLQSQLLQPTEPQSVTVVHRGGNRNAGYLYAGSSLINERVIAAGQAAAARRDVHPFRPWLLRTERKARQKQQGLWAKVGRDPALIGDTERP